MASLSECSNKMREKRLKLRTEKENIEAQLRTNKALEDIIKLVD